MNNIVDDEYRISYYTEKKPKIIDPSSDIEKALEWCRDSNLHMVIPTADLEHLEKTWIEFNSMSKINRRRSDWKSLEIFGKTNQDTYEECRSMELKNRDNDISTIDDFNDDYVTKEKMPVVESSVLDDYYNIDYDNTEVFEYTQNDVDDAVDWAIHSSRAIIVPTRTLYDLETIWDAYNSMLLKHRRESDWKSLEIFGVTNLKHYEHLKSKFLQQDIDKINISHDKLIETSYITSAFTKKYLNSIKESSTHSLTRYLLDMTMPAKDIYEETLSNNIINDILDSIDSGSMPSVDSPSDMPYIDSNDMIDMGVFSANPELNYYGELADNTMLNDNISVKEWFELYRMSDIGFYTEFYDLTSDWVNKVRELTYSLDKIKESGNIRSINARKQSILELGWDPDIPFNNKTRLIANESARYRMNTSNSKVVDLTHFYEAASTDKIDVIIEEKYNGLNAVYIVIIEGKSYLSTIIRQVTKDIYSHAAISLDSSLKTMYSYGIAKTQHTEGNGFRIETIEDIPLGSHIRVFGFFVPDHVYKKIQEFIDTFKNNSQKTSYSFINLLTYLFNIPYNRDWSLICSQFVDRCLKAADIDITNMDSSLVSPNAFNVIFKDNKKIYTLYSGLATKYNHNKVDNLVKSLSRTAYPLKEHKEYSSSIEYINDIRNNINNIDGLKELAQYIDTIDLNVTSKRLIETMVFDNIQIAPYVEAKEFPIQFDKDGNLLIRNLRKLDYDAEYSKSHKLLKEYLKVDNRDGIKYELSKLWMMICKLEEKLHSRKFKNATKEEIDNAPESKSRARIINDFKYYLNELLKRERDFNFTDYYESSPFSNTTKINATTLKFSAQMIKSFIKSI